MSEFGMPVALELEAARRSGIPAFRREVVHNTTTQNEYRPGELCYIPVDTGAAGAFMDVSCTRLEFVVTVQNKNYFTDFINLPRCGWNAIIQEFGIELNNGLHEMNRHYAECVELMMIKRGENRVPFEMTRTNPWKAAHGTAGQLHINFIKPSMVTLTGTPHGVKYRNLGTATANTTPDFISNSFLYYSQPYLHEMFGRLGNTPLQQLQLNFMRDHVMASSTIDATPSVYDDQLNTHQDYYRTNRIATTGGNIVATNDGIFTGSVNVNFGESSDNFVASVYKFVGQPQGNNLRKLARSDVPLAEISTYSAAYGQSVTGKSPGQWPVGQPCPLHELEKEYKENLRLVNANNVMNYYANVKNIPVGIPVDLDADPTGKLPIYGDNEIKTKPAIGEYGHETQFHVCVKLYSSLIGELADRWFPELVVPQGRMRVRIRFQEANILFQTLMDPCRRVPGTTRDFIPYIGLINSRTAAGPVGQGQISRDQLITQIASGIHPTMIPDSLGNQNSAASVFVDAVALGKFPLPILRMRAMHVPFGGTSTAWADLPEDANMNSNHYVSVESAPYAAGAQVGSIASIITTLQGADGAPKTAAQLAANHHSITKLAKYAYELHQNQEYGFPANVQTRDANGLLTVARGAAVGGIAVDQKPTTIGHYEYYSFPTDWGNRFQRNNRTDVWVKTQDNATAPGFLNADLYQLGIVNGQQVAGQQGANQDEWQHSQNWNIFCVPTPQYVPRLSPEDKRATRQLIEGDYCDESQICFGTYLEGARAQVRRSHNALYMLNIADKNTSGSYERLTYRVSNVQLRTQQIILPRGTALSIVENALEGGISIECRAWKEMESMLPPAESQKHLINMAAAFCTDITFLFRPMSILTGDTAFGYNSFSFYNPFTYFDFEPEIPNQIETQYNALGGKPIYYNECIMSTRVPFDIQLQIATELLPRTPIDSINSLIRECRWGDQVFSDRDYLELDPRMMPSYQTSKGMAINTLQDGFWACYTPIHCLDDQTITDNPFFTPLEISLRRKIRGVRAEGGALPIFKPFDGTFHLAFNLEAYMGQSDRLRTGIPIVNNNMFLKLERAHLLRNTSTQLLTVASCDGKVVFERGGTVQFFT